MLVLRLLAVAILLSGFFATPSMAQSRREPVTREDAWRLFKQGDYTKAREAFQIILKRRPDDQNAKIGLARSIYHQEDWENAYRGFRGVALQTLDPETSFEYAQTMFRFERYEEALAGFQRVPPGHEMRDLAAYFGGISALRLKRYRAAQDLMDAAVRLPEPYRKNRDMYVRHIQVLLAREERRRLAKERGEGESEEAAPASTQETSDGYQYKGFYQLYREAIIGTENKTQVAKYHDRREETNHFSTRYFHFENAVVHPLSKSGEERSVLGLLLMLHAEHKDFDGLEKNLDRIPDVTSRTTEFSKTGRGAGTLFTEWVLGRGFRLDLQGALEQEYPDFGKKLSYSKHSGGIGFGQVRGTYQARLFAQFLETLDAKSEVRITESQYNLEMFGVPATWLELAFVAQHSVFDYKTVGIDGPASRTRFDGEAKFNLPLKFDFILQGRFEANAGFVRHDIANLPNVTYDKSAGRAVATLRVRPLTWIELGAKVQEDRQWLTGIDPAQPLVVDEVQKAEASKVLETAFYGELNLFF